MLRTTLAALLLLGSAPQADLKSRFETARAQDPVAAFRLLADNAGTPAPFARAALAKQIGEDLAAGLKAYEAGQAALVDRHFSRAAQLGDLYAKDFSRELLRWILLLKAPHKTVAECPPCKSLGATACSACQAGRSLQPCPPCGAKGSVPCILCDGAGTLDHHGYKGTLVFNIDRDTKISFKNDQGKTARGTLNAQTLTYQMNRCSGGSFGLQTESLVAKTGDKKSGSTTQTCAKFWTEMKLFAFSGRAKIKVNTPKGPLTPVSPALARRFFSDYETCTGGRVPCDRCAGRKTDPCSLCATKGQTLLPCLTCEGTSSVACGTCRGFGDSVWMARVIPQAPALAEALVRTGALLKDWLNARAGRTRRAADLARRLDDARKGADAGAKFNGEAGVVDVSCPKCKGSGGECEECWGAGRREFNEGTPAYERYALIDRITRQLAELAKAPPEPLPALPPLPEAESAAPPAPATPPVPAPLVPLPGAPLVLPKTVGELIAKGDGLFETGRGHLEKSKASPDNAVWIEEGLKAVKDLRDAQACYATAQERMDEAGQAVPKDLQQKIRTALQALVMARKQIP